MKTESEKLIAALPWFPGFYNSSLDSMIDREVEQEMEDNGEEWEAVHERCNYPAAFQAITRAWSAELAKECGLSWEFVSLDSPREYNFTTDRVFVRLTPETLTILRGVLESPEFLQECKERFTHRSGFMSFYSPDPSTWPEDVSDWDHNQLAALIAGYILTTGETRESILETLEDKSNVYEAAQHVWDARPAETVEVSA